MKAHNKRSRRGNHSSKSQPTGQGVESEFLPAEILPAQLRNLSELFNSVLVTSSQMLTRTWADAFDSLLKKGGFSVCSRRRWEFIRKDKRLEKFWMRKFVQTRPGQLMALLHSTELATGLLLRRIHNHALDMKWLPFPILPVTQWSGILAEQRRAIIRKQHSKFAARQLVRKSDESLPRLEIKRP